jgi:hypothetical protein
MSRKIYRGGGRGALATGFRANVPSTETNPQKTNNLAPPNATVYTKPAILEEHYRWSGGETLPGEYTEKFVYKFGCILNQEKSCKAASAKVEYCANKLLGKTYSTRDLDNYYKDNMKQILIDSGCYALLDFVIKKERRMNAIEFNNYNTLFVILKAVFNDHFFTEAERKDLLMRINDTWVTTGKTNGYDMTIASVEAEKYKTALDRFLSSLSTKTLYDRLQRVEALKLEVEALEQKEL